MVSRLTTNYKSWEANAIVALRGEQSMRNKALSFVAIIVLLAGLMLVVINNQPSKAEATLPASLQLLGGGTRFAAGAGNSVLFVNYKDNYLAHHLTNGVDWLWFSEAAIDRLTLPVTYTLQQAGFNVTHVADIPGNLTGYDAVVINAYFAIEPRHEPLIRDYISRGGGVVLVFATPMYFGGYCKDNWPIRLGLDDLSPVQEWFGAGFFVNSGDQAYASIDNPLNTSLAEGEPVYSELGSYSFSAMTSMHNDSQVVARWEDGSVFAFTHQYGLGRLYYQAIFDDVNQGPQPPPSTWSVTITATPANTGSTSPSGTTNVTGRLTVTATPNTGYRFDNWVFDSVYYGSSNPITISEQANGTNHTLTAAFSEIVEPPPPPPPPAYTHIAVMNPQTGDRNFVFYDNTTSVGTRFNATVWVSNVTDLFSYQVYLEIDDSVLNITRVWMPAWDTQWVFYGKTVWSSPRVFLDDDADGYVEAVLFGDTIIGSDQPRFAGTGLVALIEFEITRGPTPGVNLFSVLDISKTDPYATFVLDSGSYEIPSTKTNGQYAFYDPPRLLGDLTYDGKVDIRDLAIAAKAFGSYQDTTNWNPLADINADYKVDMKDLAAIAKNYGKSAA